MNDKEFEKIVRIYYLAEKTSDVEWNRRWENLKDTPEIWNFKAILEIYEQLLSEVKP